MTDVTTVEELERVVGKPPLGIRMKAAPALDAQCERLLAASPFAVLGYADREGRARSSTLGGPRGFARALGPTLLRLPLRAADARDLDPSVGVATLFFIPGLGETLRINGRAELRDGVLLLRVEEAFAHCAKALLRSSFWQSSGDEAASDEALGIGQGRVADPGVRLWLARSPFLVITSWDGGGRADASPKGDPPGFLHVDDDCLVLPDRPGNRRTDTFHNLLEQPRVAILSLVPGSMRVLSVSGRASLTTDRALCETLAVKGRTPKIALRLSVEQLTFQDSPALATSRLWDRSLHVPRDELPRMAEVFVAHLRQNPTRGLAARAVRTLSSTTLVEWAIAHDYEKRRY